jgi:hypothetical protein
MAPERFLKILKFDENGLKPISQLVLRDRATLNRNDDIVEFIANFFDFV